MDLGGKEKRGGKARDFAKRSTGLAAVQRKREKRCDPRKKRRLLKERKRSSAEQRAPLTDWGKRRAKGRDSKKRISARGS